MIKGEVTVRADKVEEFISLPSACMKLLVALLKFSDAEQVIEMSRCKRLDIKNLLGMKHQTLNNNLVKLQKSGALTRVEKNLYKIDREYIYKS